MSDRGPKPLEGDDPYEKLGVTERHSINRIEEQYESLSNKWKNEANRAHRDRDRERYQRCNNILDAIDDAWEWIEENHEPVGVDTSVEVTAVSETVEVGNSIELRVTGQSGPISDAVVLSDIDAHETDVTDSDGRVMFEATAVDDISFTVPTSSEYDDGRATVTVTRREADLIFARVPDAVEIQQAAQVKVTDSQGRGQEGVELRHDGEVVGRTNQAGVDTVTFEEVTERATLVATKDDGDRVTYNEAQTAITIKEKTIALSLEVVSDDVVVGETATVRVTDGSGDPVNGAVVSVVSTDRTVRTNDGTGTIKIPRSRSVRLTAEKSVPASADRTYTPDSTTVSPRNKQDSLVFDEISGKLMERSNITVRVIDSSGSPVDGATVETDWGAKEPTGSKGEATIELTDSGQLQITAKKDDQFVNYESAKRKVSVKEFSRELRFAKVPSRADPGETIEVRVADQRGQGVKGVEIRTSRQNRSWYTDGDGFATVALNDGIDFVRLTASKSGGEFRDNSVSTKIKVS